MPLPAPNLDDRKFQDILDEARRLIPRYCPEWTDHNLSDPGITLLELFAWMTDLLLYRLNRVPDKNYIKFLDLLGIRLEPARAATVDLSFRLTGPHEEDLVIGRGTSVGTLQTGAQPGVTFLTERDLTIRVPHMEYILAGREGLRFHDYRPALENPEQRAGLGIFSDHPQVGDALYLGCTNDVSAHTLLIDLRCRIEGIGVDPSDPPLVWETWDGLDHRWTPVQVEVDGTGGLNRDGLVILRTPYEMAPTPVDGRVAYWLRSRVLQPRPGQPGYRDTPRITGVAVSSLGGMVPAGHAFRITGEVLGTSDGTPGQTFNLHTLPVLPRRPDEETLEIETEDRDWEAWTEVPDFGLSEADDPHYVLDDASGTIELGPRIRSPRGDEHQYGRVPPAGRRVRFSTYRSGGGLIGNVGARTLTVLQSSIPYVAWVTNESSALGGSDAEDIEHAKWRAPQVLRTHERAVNADDFEVLARRASPAVGRARCLAARDVQPTSDPLIANAGTVRLQLVPALPPDVTAPSTDQLQLPTRIREEVRAYLDERRLLGSELLLESPAFTWVGVLARVRVEPRASRGRVAAEATEALYRFIHPTAGGPDHLGWPFGRELFAGELYSLLQSIDGVDIVEEVMLHQVDPQARQFGPALGRVAPADNGLLCLFEHRVMTV